LRKLGFAKIAKFYYAPGVPELCANSDLQLALDSGR
jgi:TRAP-type mannitol/chloroaromatic compound transport system substrate-binding protein